MYLVSFQGCMIEHVSADCLGHHSRVAIADRDNALARRRIVCTWKACGAERPAFANNLERVPLGDAFPFKFSPSSRLDRPREPITGR